MTFLLLSMLFFSFTPIIWTWVFLNQALELSVKPISKVRLLMLYLGCLLGSFTPGNIGTEALRVAVNQSQLGLSVIQAIKLTVWTSFLKLGCAILFGSCLLIAFCPQNFLWQTLGILAVMLGLWSFTFYKNVFKPEITLKEQGRFLWVDSKPWIGSFFVSYCFEYLAFFLCMKQVGFGTTFNKSVTIFAITHLLARIPFMPQGLIVVEVIGLPFTYGLVSDHEKANLFFAAWALVRLVSPLLTGGLAALISRRFSMI